MIWLPSRPLPLRDESLHGLLRRGADLLGVAPRRHAAALGAQRLGHDRVIDAPTTSAVAAHLALDPIRIRVMTLAAWPTVLTGPRRVGLLPGHPFGWALPNPTRYCPRCEPEARWQLTHQLGTATACVTHRCVLVDARNSALVWGEGRHDLPPSSGADPDLVRTQSAVDQLWQQVADPQGVSSPRRSAGSLLLDLRAVTALRFVIAASQSDDDAATPAVVRAQAGAALSVDTQAQGGPSGQRGRHVARLHRPPPVAFMASTLTSSLNEVTSGTGVEDLTSQAMSSAGSVHPLLPGRIEPYVDHLHRRNRTQGLSPRHVPPSALDDWRRLARRVLADIEISVDPDSIPPLMCQPQDRFSPDWARPLARAVVIHHVLTRRSLSATVQTLGHLRLHATAVRQVLENPWDPVDESSMRTGLTDALSHGYLRPVSTRAQAAVTTIPNTVVARLATPLPGTSTLSLGRLAAAWLWTHHARAHVVACPFVDGRAAQTAGRALSAWDTAAAADDKLTLIDANTQVLREMTEVLDPAAPTRFHSRTEEAS